MVAGKTLCWINHVSWSKNQRCDHLLDCVLGRSIWFSLLGLLVLYLRWSQVHLVRFRKIYFLVEDLPLLIDCCLFIVTRFTAWLCSLQSRLFLYLWYLCSFFGFFLQIYLIIFDQILIFDTYLRWTPKLMIFAIFILPFGLTNFNGHIMLWIYLLYPFLH